MRGATAEATRTYMAARLAEGVAREHFRRVGDLWLSSVGIGTYLGDADEPTDDAYRDAVVRAAEAGANVVDTAINYRHQRSERAVGRALVDLAARGLGREQLVVTTKGGFLPCDGAPPSDPDAYREERFYARGVLRAEDVVAGCHALTPDFIEDQLEQSLANLGVATIDVYYVHNPETQLREIDRSELYRRLRAVFERLEAAATAGKIRFYGTATWTAYRQPPDGPDYLSLEEVSRLARDVAGEAHRFRFIQLPYSLAMPEAFTARNQPVGGRPLSALQAAAELGLFAMGSATIAQGRLTNGLPDWLGVLLKGLDTDAQRAIQFARSTPGLTTALVGMRRREHVEENLAVARRAPAPVEDFLKLFEVDGEG